MPFRFVGFQPIGVEPILAISKLGFLNGIPTEDFVIAWANSGHREPTGLIGNSRQIIDTSNRGEVGQG
jgi:hypothetical protein